MLDPILKLLKALNSETEPSQISLALAFGMIAGFTPFWSLHNLLVLLLVMIIRVNFSAFVAGLGLFSLLAFALDPLFHSVGHSVLTMESMKSTWTAMYNSTLWRVENFSNTIVMGSLLVSLVLFIPAHFLLRWMVTRYRDTFLKLLKKSRAVQLLKASRIYTLYSKAAD